MKLSVSLLAPFVFVATLVAPTVATADICGNAWRQRNEIYKRNGYCFKTSRAINAFGNAGCSYDSVGDVPLSARERTIITELRAYERNMGCTDE